MEYTIVALPFALSAGEGKDRAGTMDEQHLPARQEEPDRKPYDRHGGKQYERAPDQRHAEVADEIGYGQAPGIRESDTVSVMGDLSSGGRFPGENYLGILHHLEQKGHSPRYVRIGTIARVRKAQHDPEG